MEPFECGLALLGDKVIKRPVMDTIKNRIKTWYRDATIIHGRHGQSGKNWAVCLALRGVRGVVQLRINSADWRNDMCKQEGLDNIGMFDEVMRRVRGKLKDFPDNLTKYPILLLNISHFTTEGLSGSSMFFVFCLWSSAFFASHVFCLPVPLGKELT